MIKILFYIIYILKINICYIVAMVFCDIIIKYFFIFKYIVLTCNIIYYYIYMNYIYDNYSLWFYYIFK